MQCCPFWLTFCRWAAGRLTSPLDCFSLARYPDATPTPEAESAAKQITSTRKRLLSPMTMVSSLSSCNVAGGASDKATCGNGGSIMRMTECSDE